MCNSFCLYFKEGDPQFYLPITEMALPQSAVDFLWCPQSFLPSFSSYLLLQIYLSLGLCSAKGLQVGLHKL